MYWSRILFTCSVLNVSSNTANSVYYRVSVHTIKKPVSFQHPVRHILS